MGGQQTGFNIFGVVLTDDSGNRYVLSSDRTWNYLFLAPGSSSSGNPAVFRDSNSGNYMIYPDTVSGNRYVRNADNTRTYLTGFPSATPTAAPLSFNDAYNNTYHLYSDA